MQTSAALLKNLLAETFPAALYEIPEFAYLAWIDFISPWHDKFNQAEVALLPGSVYGAGLDNYARLNFATSPQILKEAFTRLK